MRFIMHAYTIGKSRIIMHKECIVDTSHNGCIYGRVDALHKACIKCMVDAPYNACLYGRVEAPHNACINVEWKHLIMHT